MLEKSCPSKKTNAPECWFDFSQAYIYMTHQGKQLVSRSVSLASCITSIWNEFYTTNEETNKELNGILVT